MSGASDARDAALTVLQKLVDAGHVAYFAGGCVRDRLLGLEPKDFDIATDARPDEVKQVFPRARSVGESFGVHLVRRGRHTIEVATFRAEGVYHDGRHPESVTFSDAEHDARRRDFTINGLFEDPLTDTIIDHVGGQRDIEARVIRAIDDPAARLSEDHLRMLRAIRFAARFRFAIDGATADAISASAADLRGVSRERVGQEVRWMLSDPNRAVAAWEMQFLGLDGAVLDEGTCLVAPCRLGRLPEDAAFSTALAAWVVDRHDAMPDEPKEVVTRWTASLKLSGAERQGMLECLEVYDTLLRRWPGLGVAGQKRLAGTTAFREGLMLLAAEDPAALVEVQRRVSELAESGISPHPLLGGDDLIAAGMSPGPPFKAILDAVYDAQLEGAVTTPDEARALARVLAGPGGGPSASEGS